MQKCSPTYCHNLPSVALPPSAALIVEPSHIEAAVRCTARRSRPHLPPVFPTCPKRPYAARHCLILFAEARLRPNPQCMQLFSSLQRVSSQIILSVFCFVPCFKCSSPNLCCTAVSVRVALLKLSQVRCTPWRRKRSQGTQEEGMSNC